MEETLVEYFKVRSQNFLGWGAETHKRCNQGCTFLVKIWNGNLREGSCTRDCVGYVKGRLWKWASFSIGASLGNLEGGLPGTLGDSEREVCIPSVSLHGSRTWTVLLIGTLKALKTCQGRLWIWRISLLIVASWGEPGGRVPMLMTLRDMKRKALEPDHYYYGAP